MGLRYPQPDNERTFEKFCLKFLQRHWSDVHLELYGKRGEEQFGVDIIDMSGSESLRAGQCKHHEPTKTIPPREIEEEVSKALSFPTPINHFAILTTARVSTQAQNAIIGINKSHKNNNIEMFVELFSWDKTEDLLDGYPDVADFLMQASNTNLKRIEEKQIQINEQFQHLSGMVLARFGEAGAGSITNPFDAEIDEAEALVKNHNPQVAWILLEKIRKRHWEALSDSQKYRVMVALADVEIFKGNDIEAGKILIEAKKHLPEAERALINEAMGFELMHKREEAHELAERLLERFPNSGPLVSCWIRTAPKSATLDQLRSRVTAATESDAQVNVALSIRAYAIDRYEEAESFARQAIKANPEWVGPKSILGQALVNQAKHKFKLFKTKETKGCEKDVIGEAISVLTETLTLAESQGKLRHVADCFAFRGLAHSLREEYERADDDYRDAIKWLPDNATVYLQFATYLLDRRKHGEAIDQLRKSISIVPGVEAEYCLAEALVERTQQGDLPEAITILARIVGTDDASLVSSQPQPESGLLESLRAEAFNKLIDCLVDGDRLEEFEGILAAVPSGRFSEVSLLTARAKICLAKGETEASTAMVDQAIRAIAPDSLKYDLRNLAQFLMKIERHKNALGIWQILNGLDEQLIDLRPLVKCAERVKQYGVILRACQKAREYGVEDRWLFDQEIMVLEMFDVERAIALLRERLSSHPEDKHARLHLSRIGLYLRREELVDASPENLLSLDEATPYGGHVVVEILRRYGDPNEAVRFAYELFRRHFEDHLANQTLVMAVMAHRTKQPVFGDCSVVRPGTAVRYVEGGHSDAWIIIEDSPNPNLALNEYPATHPLCQSLLGKAVGDTFLIAKTSGRDRVGTVKEILPKYVYRVRDIWDHWQTRFPDVPFVQVFKVEKDGESTENKQFDMTDMKLIADERHERLKEVERLYEGQTPDQAVSLHMLGKALGCSTFEGFHFAALSPKIHLRSNHPGRANQVASGVEALRSGSTLVVDITALASISLLGLNDLLAKWTGKMVISQSTASELRSALEEFTDPTKRRGSFGKSDDGYFFLPETPEDVQTRAEAAQAFCDLVFEKCEQRGCPEMADLEPDHRDKLSDHLGQDAVESMLLARAPGHILWTEDYVNAEAAAAEFGARRVWTQLVIHHAESAGLMSTDQYLVASAKLIGYRYAATASNSNIIIKAGEMANWDIRRWPFVEALEVFEAEHVPRGELGALAALTIKELYGRADSTAVRREILIRVIELMYFRQDGRGAVFQLLRNIPSLFNDDFVSADEVSQVIRSWLAETSKRPRILGI